MRVQHLLPTVHTGQNHYADIYRYNMLLHSLLCVQLHTSRQLAAIIVHTHPWVPCKHHLLEELARQQKQAPVAQILAAAESDNLDHSADWEEVVSYLQTITPDNLHQYVPLGAYQHTLLGSSDDLFDSDFGLAEEILSVLV